MPGDPRPMLSKWGTEIPEQQRVETHQYQDAETRANSARVEAHDRMACSETRRTQAITSRARPNLSGNARSTRGTNHQGAYTQLAQDYGDRGQEEEEEPGSTGRAILSEIGREEKSIL